MVDNLKTNPQTVVYKGLNFEDFIIDVQNMDDPDFYERDSCWSQVCQGCYERINPGERGGEAEVSINGIICGVENCQTEAVFYIEFDEEIFNRLFAQIKKRSEGKRNAEL